MARVFRRRSWRSGISNERLQLTGDGDILIPEGVGLGYLVTWLLVMYLGYSGVYLGHLAWGARLAPTYQQRSRIFGAITGLESISLAPGNIFSFGDPGTNFYDYDITATDASGTVLLSSEVVFADGSGGANGAIPSVQTWTVR